MMRHSEEAAEGNLRILGICYAVFGVFSVLSFLGMLLASLLFPSGDLWKTLEPMLQNNPFVTEQMKVDMAAFIQVIIPLLKQAMFILLVVHVLTYLGLAWCFVKKRHYWTCMFGAIFTCLSFPLGTILGVFSIIVLNKPQCRELFD